MFTIRCRENGDIIDRFETFADAFTALDEYEQADRNDGAYTPDFYEVLKDDEVIYPLTWTCALF